MKSKWFMSRFPLSDIKFHNIPVVGQFYTKTEVDGLIKDAVDEARRIDEESMRKHNRDATVISMILGFTTLAPVSYTHLTLPTTR